MEDHLSRPLNAVNQALRTPPTEHYAATKTGSELLLALVPSLPSDHGP